MNIETDLEKFPNILQQRKKASKLGDNIIFQSSYDNLLIKPEKYEKRGEIKGSKAWEKRWDGKIEQVKGDRMFKIKVYHVFQ